MLLKKCFAGIIIFILGIVMSSCDPCVDYVYIISNKSEETIYLEFNNGVEREEEAWIHWGYDSITYLGSQNEELGNNITSLELKPGETVKFLDCIFLSAYVQDNPEDDGSRPLWLNNYCIKNIYIGDEENKKEVPEEYWSNRNNWTKQNKKTYYVEYWLNLDEFI